MKNYELYVIYTEFEVPTRYPVIYVQQEIIFLS